MYDKYFLSNKYLDRRKIDDIWSVFCTNFKNKRSLFWIKGNTEMFKHANRSYWKKYKNTRKDFLKIKRNKELITGGKFYDWCGKTSFNKMWK